MSHQRIRVSVRGMSGQEPTQGRFFACLGAAPDSGVELIPSASAWQPSLVVLFEEERADVPLAKDDFVERIAQGFQRAAAWLATCAEAGLAEWRAQGFGADVCVANGTLQDQMALKIPLDFLRQCGRLGLRLLVLTDPA